MPIIAQGGTVTLSASVAHSNGSPADDPAITLTVTPFGSGVAVAGFPVVIPAIEHDAIGAYHYDWAVPIDLAVGDYTASWDATVDGAAAGGDELVEVVAVGTVTADLSVTDLRTFIDSPLSDTALGTYLTAAYAAIDEALGPLIVHEHVRVSYGPLLMLGRRADTITTVVEDARWQALTLAADDYELSDSRMVLTRLHDGTNPRYYWHGWVDVTYVRMDDQASRDRAAVALVQLDLNSAPGLASQQIGTWSESYRGGSYTEQRDAILAALLPTPMPI